MASPLHGYAASWNTARGPLDRIEKSGQVVAATGGLVHFHLSHLLSIAFGLCKSTVCFKSVFVSPRKSCRACSVLVFGTCPVKLGKGRLQIETRRLVRIIRVHRLFVLIPAGVQMVLTPLVPV